VKESFWSGKTIVITGASSGIGEAIQWKLNGLVRRAYLLSRNPHVTEVPANNLTETKWQKLMKALGPEPVPQIQTELVPISVDMSSPEDIRNVLNHILEKERESDSGGIDVLFNNAGITAHGRFDETDISVFRKTFDVNFFGPIQLIQGLLPLVKKKKGIVVSTSTVSGLYGVPGRAAYSASKSALHAAMESLRIEMLGTGVRSIIVCPPYTRTRLRTSGLDSQGNLLQEPQAQGKIKTPEQVALEIIQAVERPKSRLVTFDLSGAVMKYLRVFSPGLLERIMHRKLRHDFSEK
jgi:NAD(P)-dependent dehydrogenase (short-subunit alcohol dehydrogenase family)